MRSVTMGVFAVALLFLELLAVATVNFSFCNGSTDVGCNPSERKALLSFKQDLWDPSNRLASWVGDGDCCTWAGVVCDSFIGHVLELHLQNPHLNYLIHNYAGSSISFITLEAEEEAYERSMLGGKINPSLLDLKHLIYLDLSHNNFESIKIPKFLGSMNSLRYLNLSNAGFSSIIPHEIGNLSNLKYLDLNSKYDYAEVVPGLLYIEDLFWLSGLSSLEYLDLSDVDLGNASDHWLPIIITLPSLRVLHLSYCALHHFPLLPIINISSLTSARSRNFGLSYLTFLDLSGNYFQGRIPDQLQNLTSLRQLDLSDNGFNTSLPEWLYEFSHLEYLSLGSNSLQGVVSSTIGNLTSIRFLDLSDNELEGRISRSFGRLCNLRSIFLSSVKLNQDISKILDVFSRCISDNLELLELSNSQISGHFPNQVGQFQNLHTLKIGHNFISGPIPECFLTQLLSLRVLDISSNKLTGVLSEIHFANVTRLTYFDASENPLALMVSIDWIPCFQLKFLNLKSCNLEHGFPFWVHTQRSLSFLDVSNSGILDNIPISSPFWNITSHFAYLNLSCNQMYGQIPNLTNASFLSVLDVSSNKFSGPLPLLNSKVSIVNFSNNTFSGSITQFLCYQQNESKETEVLRLRNNFLGEELPDCWRSWQSLVFLDLVNNEFTGTLPTSMGALIALKSLRLRKNHLFGTIPVALKNCTELTVIDISENKLTGTIPKWIGERFSNLIFLNLRSNKFHGFFPLELCSLALLQILDLADNILSGAIPRCINNISAMVTTRPPTFKDVWYDTNYTEPTDDALLVTKGKTMEYNTILNLVRFIDLSKNKFSGEIPSEMTYLKAVQSLNLSYNSFMGRIPENFGAMISLESLDISSNQLTGEIPQSISSLTFLSYLNVSNNNLSGKIPLGTQLQGFDPSCFMGNELCGSPLPKNCSSTSPTTDFENGEGNRSDEEHEVNWFYVSMALGFVVGFWSLIGPLLVNRRWRYIYCRFLDRLDDLFGNFANKCF